MSQVPARYNDGIVARVVEVSVQIGTSGLDIRDAAGVQLDQWPAAEVRLIDRPAPRRPLRLSCGDNDFARLTIDDPDTLDELKAVCPNLRKGRRIDRQGALRIGAWILAAGVSVAVLVKFVIPIFASQVAAAIPVSVEERIGKRVSDQIVGLLALVGGKRPADCVAPQGTRALAQVVGRLIANADLRDYGVRVRVIDSPLVNAFAMPGGHILLPRGMIGFVDNAEELAGVLAHEIGHVVYQHPTATMLKVATTSLLASLIVGDIAGGTIAVGLAQHAIRSGYGREAEREADDYARQMLERASIDSRSFAGFFAKLAARESDLMKSLQFLSTHPSTRERADQFAKSAGPGRAVLDVAQWRNLRQICN